MLTLPTRLRRIAEALRSDVFRRVMASAQKAALVWWRDRVTPPGVAARFTSAGERFYRFGDRGTTQARKRPLYVQSGQLRAAVLRRRPTTRYKGGAVETRLSIDGGALNALSRVNPLRAQHRTTRTVVVSYQVPAHQRRSPGGKLVAVVGYSVMREQAVRTRVDVRAPPSMRAEFAPRPADLRAIEARVRYEWERAAKRIALTKDGRIRAGMRREGVSDGG